MSSFGVRELVVILLIVVLLFGAKKIPEIAKGLGKGIKDFKGAMKEGEASEDAQAGAKTPDSENRPSA